MTTNAYTCPLTGSVYEEGEDIFFRLVRSGPKQEMERRGVLMHSAGDGGGWRVLAKINGHGEILRISDEGRAAAPASIRKA